MIIMIYHLFFTVGRSGPLCCVDAQCLLLAGKYQPEGSLAGFSHFICEGRARSELG